MHCGPLGILRDWRASLCADVLLREELGGHLGQDEALGALWQEFRERSRLKRSTLPRAYF
eukprot:8954783-Alexandrium_andersonii.AAC.1